MDRAPGAASSSHREPGDQVATTAAAATAQPRAPAVPGAREAQPLDNWLVHPEEPEDAPVMAPETAAPPGIGPLQTPPEDGGDGETGRAMPPTQQR